jgi:hypothetical protein
MHKKTAGTKRPGGYEPKNQMKTIFLICLFALALSQRPYKNAGIRESHGP